MHVIDELASFVATHPVGSLSGQMQDQLVTDLMAATATGFASGLAASTHEAADQVYEPGATRL